MLVLSRKRDSSIHIGADIRVKILGIHGNQVKVGVEAPAAVPVWRGELPPRGQSSLELQTSEDRAALGREEPFEVLLVEDDLGHAKLICGAFSECRLPRPIDVAVAQTGELAAESLGMGVGQRPTAPPGLVLLDLHLPRMTGLELLMRIRTDPFLHLTPVVVLSCANDSLGYAPDRVVAKRGGYAAELVPLFMGARLPYANIHDELVNALLAADEALFT